ncbi:MAG: hypothetical protein HYW08_09105 [candidate division NC10 bacterium]|nr:hypothetical protein [candidate division NC10 bacterium]MBI2562535.1 hypothetical protein [candidate division NC10 bacterium]MBI3085231.1 hypothetical protein [candidate division NC10 bacterium]
MKWPGLLLVITLTLVIPAPARRDGEANVKERGRPAPGSVSAPVGPEEQPSGGRTAQGEDKPQRFDVVALNHRWATLPAETLPGEGPRFR